MGRFSKGVRNISKKKKKKGSKKEKQETKKEEKKMSPDRWEKKFGYMSKDVLPQIAEIKEIIWPFEGDIYTNKEGFFYKIKNDIENGMVMVFKKGRKTSELWPPESFYKYFWKG